MMTMKKKIWIVVALLIVALAAVYLLIPSQIQVTKVVVIKAPISASNRYFLDPKKWQQWWPSSDSVAKQTSNNIGFFYKTASHTPTQALFNGYGVNTLFNDMQLKGEIIYAQIGLESVAYFWKYQYSSSYNPFKRVADYFTLKALLKNTGEVLAAMKAFLESEEKLYGMKINHSMVVDTLLVSTKAVFPFYPNNDQVYQMIDALKNYVQQKGAKQKGYPMLNVTRLDSTHYQTMVALPVDKQLDETSNFSWKKMVAGKILISEVKGGEARAREALNQMHNYVTDYQITSPAIPFISFITDRKSVKDSSIWISRIYYPVM